MWGENGVRISLSREARRLQMASQVAHPFTLFGWQHPLNEDWVLLKWTEPIFFVAPFSFCFILSSCVTYSLVEKTLFGELCLKIFGGTQNLEFDKPFLLAKQTCHQKNLKSYSGSISFKKGIKGLSFWITYWIRAVNRTPSCGLHSR